MATIDWTPTLETTLFQGIILYRPLGIHKHIRHILIQRFIMNNMGIHVPIESIKSKLDGLYDVEFMETLTNQEFELPYEEYENLIEIQRRAEESSDDESELKKKKRVVRKKRK